MVKLWLHSIYFGKIPFFLFILFIFFILGPHLQHMKVPRLGVESGMLLLAYATATATPDHSHSLQQHQTLYLPSKARVELTSLQRLCQVLNSLSHSGNCRRIIFIVIRFFPSCSLNMLRYYLAIIVC